MKQKILEIIGWLVLVMFVALFVFSIKVSKNNYEDYLAEYENAQDEIVYKVYEYKQSTTPKGKVYYTIVVDDVEYHTSVVEYKIGGGDGFYLVMTKKEKSSYMQYFFYGIATIRNTRDVYSYKLVVVY